MKHGTARGPRFRGAPIDLVLDVRSRLEYWMGHLPDAVCVPVDHLPEGIADRIGLSTKSRILVYCASGVRSATAKALLSAAGYTNVVDGGGIAAARDEFTD